MFASGQVLDVPSEEPHPPGEKCEKDHPYADDAAAMRDPSVGLDDRVEDLKEDEEPGRKRNHGGPLQDTRKFSPIFQYRALRARYWFGR